MPPLLQEKKGIILQYNHGLIKSLTQAKSRPLIIWLDLITEQKNKEVPSNQSKYVSIVWKVKNLIECGIWFQEINKTFNEN